MATLLTADLIRAARGLLGWSQLELAHRSGVSQKALSDFERNKRPLTAYASEKLRKVLEAHSVQFIAENDKRNELVGAGVRWRSDRGSLHIKIV
ncbi:helix-turn-helix transcriptional regulator [Sinorhizobium meliloti]|uniref:helix-turn-helix domain-containing protein n=1 Tax=Rhizobium meliloti TaxID=382 RepID=UPI00299DE279|nr:helix-turn-helix domain-containing protein [Sinorhizobium meliloti]